MIASTHVSAANVDIFLVRHGRPNAGLAERRAIAGTQIGQWYSRYNELGIVETLPPPSALMSGAASVRCIVASDSRRAMESAAVLAAGRQFAVDAELREVGFPDSMNVALPLPPATWVWLTRAAWLANRCDTHETVAYTRARAVRAADRLCALAETHHSVMVVGHGFFNQFLARELRSRQWQGPRMFRSHYWSAVKYQRS